MNTKKKMKPTMTIGEVLKDMRMRGMAISQRNLTLGVENGVFPFVTVLSVGETGRKNVLIFTRDYAEWATKYIDMEGVEDVYGF